MKRSFLFKATTAILVSISFFCLIHESEISVPQVQAFQTECPEGMDPNSLECLNFLKQQQQQITIEKDRLSNSITAEQLEQLSLSEQISYLNDRIHETELTISEIEIEIEKKNVEVNLLNSDIIDLEKTVDTLTQEINVLENSVNQRTQISYKLSKISPLEVFLDSGDLENLFRKIKYLLEIKKQDQKYLADMTVSHNSLKVEEDLLKNKKAEVEDMREDIEIEYTDLADARINLESQKNQQQILKAQSETREREMVVKFETYKEQQSAIDAEIIAYIQRTQAVTELSDGTAVPSGTPIGRMGSTGLSTGPHLHFSIGTSSDPLCWGSVNLWNGYYVKGPDTWYGLYKVHSGILPMPLAGTVVLTQDFHQNRSIDLYSLYGAGTPVYSVGPGLLFTSTDPYGGIYAYIRHYDGSVSCYLHLQSY